MTIQCCCCGHVKDDHGHWSEPDHQPVEKVSHSYCDECYDKELSRLRVYREYMRAETVAA